MFLNRIHFSFWGYRQCKGKWTEVKNLKDDDMNEDPYKHISSEIKARQSDWDVNGFLRDHFFREVQQQ